MVLTIFKFELRSWLSTTSVYVYAFAFLMLAIGSMAGSAGIFGEGSTAATTIANSPLSLYTFITFFNKLLLFLLPTIIGNSTYRDYRSSMHSVLYAYPFSKREYLVGKFLSALLIVAAIATMVGIGLFIGTQLPGVNGAMLLPFDFAVYAQLYVVYLLPNMLLMGTIVFACVVLSRNIYAGFIAMIILLITREAVARMMGAEASVAALLLEPFGEAATNAATRGWTFAERNQLLVPINPLIVFNRLLWVAISLGVFAYAYKWFSFSQNAVVMGARASERKPLTRKSVGSIITMKLPNVTFRHSFIQYLKSSWQLSNADFRFIVTSGSFVSIVIAGSLFVFILLLQMNPQYETRILPVTWVMLAFPVFFFSVLIMLMTFLYAGILVHRTRASRMHELVDASPIPNWALLFSKFLALVKIQVLLLSLVMISGIVVQAYNGYYRFEIGQYVFALFGIHLIGFVIWACAALFVQTTFSNPFMGLFVLILASLGIAQLPQLGIEQLIFRFNESPEPDFFLKYSDLSGYGHSLVPYFVYKSYWFLFGVVLMIGALLMWQRGVSASFKERLAIAFARLNGRLGITLAATMLLFASAGFWIHSMERSADNVFAEQEIRRLIAEADKKYSQFAHTAQPRITAVRVAMHIVPESLSFRSDGRYTIVNNSHRVLDTLLVNYAFNVKTTYTLDRATSITTRDTISRFDIHRLREGLQPGDSLQMTFDVESIPNSLLHKNSIVENNGTFITSLIYPALGYRRENSMADPSDSSALRNHYRSFDSDYISFEATVGTSEDQIAIAPGTLRREWRANGRRFFQYASESRVTNDFVFTSGRYEVRRDVWNGVAIEIFHHKEHVHNLNHMIRGMKAALEYNETNYSPYQHKHVRVVEFSRTQGNFAQSFATTIPYSEVGFIMDIDDTESGGLNLPLLGVAHEMTHQWWGHQVIPADVLGTRMITESVAEFVSLKAMQKIYGDEKAQKFLRKALDIYLRKRADETESEKPLMYNVGLSKSFIPYQKGSLVLNATSEYIGEAKLNAALRAYLEHVRFQNPPYTTSVEFVEFIRRATPDSLRHLITDMFETVTFYDNRILTATARQTPAGTYHVDVEFVVSKYRIDGNGNRTVEGESGTPLSYTPAGGERSISSLPLADYVEVVILRNDPSFGKNILYRKRHKISQIHNQVSIIVAGKPSEVGVDPFTLLIDSNSRDNRERIRTE